MDYYGKYLDTYRKYGGKKRSVTQALGAGRIAEAQIDAERKRNTARLQTLSFLNEGIQNVLANLEKKQNIKEGLKEMGVEEPQNNFLTNIWEAITGPDMSKEYSTGEFSKPITAREANIYSKMKAGYPEQAQTYLNYKQRDIYQDSLDSARKSIESMLSYEESQSVMSSFETDEINKLFGD